MRKAMGFIMLLSLLLSCTTLSTNDYKGESIPYGEDEFPEGLVKLRRAEILLLGSLPLFYMFTSMGYDLFMPELPDSQTQLAQKFTISLSLSGILTLTDFILGEWQNEGKTENG